MVFVAVSTAAMSRSERQGDSDDAARRQGSNVRRPGEGGLSARTCGATATAVRTKSVRR